jgi:hypothetical protein
LIPASELYSAGKKFYLTHGDTRSKLNLPAETMSASNIPKAGEDGGQKINWPPFYLARDSWVNNPKAARRLLQPAPLERAGQANRTLGLMDKYPIQIRISLKSVGKERFTLTVVCV